jgi:glycosyltransferase involved in cell wall biosynthesis
MVRRALGHDGVGAILYVGGVGILGVPTKHPSPIPRFAVCDSIWQSRPHDHPLPQGVAPSVARAIARREVESLHDVSHVFCTSRAAADDVLGTGVDTERVTVIGTGTGPIRPYEGPKNYTSGRILFVAQQRAEEKGLSVLLRAFEFVRSANPSATLTVVGGSAKLDPERLPQGVAVLPRVDLATLQSLFEQATLFAMPALFEPWGLVYLESLLCRTPVLGLRRMGYPEIAGGGRYGFIVDRPDPRLVADGILSAFSNPARLATMGKEGQAKVLARFTWAATAERIHSVLERYV